MTKIEVHQEISNLLHNNLFSGIREIIVEKEKIKLINSKSFKSLSQTERTDTFNKYYKKWYKEISNFFLSYQSIVALHKLVERELKIRAFETEEITRIKVDYVHNDVPFCAYLPTHYSVDMMQEVEDTIAYLKRKDLNHVVVNYIEKKDHEKEPPAPLTLAEAKYNAFYLFGFEPSYTTKLLFSLFDAGLITKPETNGWNIDDDFIDDIIVYLGQFYPDDKIIQYKRTYTDRTVDRNQECIRPCKLFNNYVPANIITTDEFKAMNIDEVEKKDAIKLYGFIFNLTVATQMKNSIYDVSSVEIQVGEKILLERSNIVLEGQENWELIIGNTVRKINSNSIGMSNKITCLPKFKFEDRLNPIEIYRYAYNSRRPFRFGVGRFLTQILEKNNIAQNEEQDKIVTELITSRAVVLIGNMLHPQENSIILIQWLSEYMPILLDPLFFQEIQEKIESVVIGDIELNTVLQQFETIIESGFSLADFVPKHTKPSEAKLKLFHAVVAKNNLNVDSSVYENNVAIDKILAQYATTQPVKVGSCPKCNNVVYRHEYIKDKDTLYYFMCENGGRKGTCSFSLWDNYINKFFNTKGIQLHTIEERTDVLKKILSKKRGYLFNDFISKTQKKYDAKIFVEAYEDRDTKQEKWQFGMKFINKKAKK